MDTPRKPVPFPTKEQIRTFVEGSPGKVGKREIARAFGIRGAAKVELKKLLREMERDGQIGRPHRRNFAKPGQMPDVTVIEVASLDRDGELWGRAVSVDIDGPAPKIYIVPDKAKGAFTVGDRLLCRMRPKGNEFEARVIKRISEAPAQILGIYQKDGSQGRLVPTDRRVKKDFIIADEHKGEAKTGDLVICEPLSGRVYGLKPARVVEVLGDSNAPKAVSLICIHASDIPYEFSDEAIVQAEQAKAVPLGNRVDLRQIPLVTIDGADARDFDDAVFAEPDESSDNPGGWHLIVAIADVAHYVQTGDALDKCAYERGNSVYFPDRVVPMLPEALSNGWCSLVPHEDRGCLAVHMWIDANGHLLRHRFERGLMRSHARLTYEQMQAARDGMADETTQPLMNQVVSPLYQAYECLMAYRQERNVLELDVPERKMAFDEAGQVASIDTRVRLDSHRLIEEFMITANVAAAEALESKNMPCMYRIHDAPGLDKMEALRQFLGSLDLKLAKGQAPSSKAFNQILAAVVGRDENHMVNTAILRSQSQAEYSPDNIGHFGLALQRYAHFTSPIRRYADLMVHRALIRAFKLGEGALETPLKDFHDIGAHLSVTERRAAQAERDAMDRYTALYMADRVGATFEGRINGVTRFGLFVTLNETGADGLVPIRSLPQDYYDHDEQLHTLTGSRNGIVFRLGEHVNVKLVESNTTTGGMVFQVILDQETLSRANKSIRTKHRKGGRKGHGIKGKQERKSRQKRHRRH